MTQEAIKEFLDYLAANKEAMTQFQKSFAQGTDVVIACAKKLGYKINENDLKEFQEAAKNTIIQRTQQFLADDSELSEGMKNLKNFLKYSVSLR